MLRKKYVTFKRLLANYTPPVKLSVVPQKVEEPFKEITYIDKETEIFYLNKKMADEISQFTNPNTQVISILGYAGGDLGKVEAW